MKVKPMGVLWMMLTGWLNHLPGAAGRALRALPEGRLMDGMNKSTLLGASAKRAPNPDSRPGRWPALHGPTGRRERGDRTCGSS